MLKVSDEFRSPYGSNDNTILFTEKNFGPIATGKSGRNRDTVCLFNFGYIVNENIPSDDVYLCGMADTETKRLSRLTAILLQLQSRRMVTATALADKFAVSVRTIYRDIKALEQAGVPILVEEGKGYRLMEGYRIPPVMFTERQANALILAEQLVLKNKDASLIRDYAEAVEKIKAVLLSNAKDKANLLKERTTFEKISKFERTSSSLSILQDALTNFYLAKFAYSNAENITSLRTVEPFALINTVESWLLVAYCHLRQDFRFFRLDRISNLEILSQQFQPHNMTLQQFFEKYHGH